MLIIRAGPVGLVAIITCQLYSPSMIIMAGIDQDRLKATKSLEAYNYERNWYPALKELFVRTDRPKSDADQILFAHGTSWYPARPIYSRISNQWPKVRIVVQCHPDV